jgi:hypothetical protein
MAIDTSCADRHGKPGLPCLISARYPDLNG